MFRWLPGTRGLPKDSAGAMRGALIMSAKDKAGHAAEKAQGKAQVAKGHVTGDPEERSRGRAKQAKSDVKQAGEKVKDSAKKATHEAKGAGGKIKDATTRRRGAS
jgi:uncharacterized protein YjbJ (UPF0337 family)